VLLLPLPADGVLVAEDEVHLWREGGREGGRVRPSRERGGRKGGREKGLTEGRAQGVSLSRKEGGREGGRAYLGATALVRPKHNHIGGLII